MDSSHAAQELKTSGLFRSHYNDVVTSDPNAAASLLRRIKDKQGGTTGVVLTLSSLSFFTEKGDGSFFMVFLQCPEGMR